MSKRVALVLFAAALVLACKTPDGPRFPLPAQDVSAPIPDGAVRVVFFNTSNHLLYFESGPIRIQLDGNQIPSIWLDHYIQVYAEPGEPEVFLKVYNNPTSTKYKQVDELPADFHSRFKPGRDPNNW